jgi:hypothetical protein
MLKSHTENFYEYYELDKNTDKENAIIGIYYALTSMATVGFGDFAPRSNPERLYITVVLVFGVSIFSLCLSTLTELIDASKEFGKEFDDRDAL